MESMQPKSPEAHTEGAVRSAALLMLLSVVLFTGNVLLIRVLGNLAQVNAWVVVTFRFVVGLAVLFGFFYRRGGFRPLHFITNPLLIIRGIMGGVGIWIYYLTILELGPGRATFISNTYIIFGAVMAGLFLGETLSRRLVISLILSMIGLALLTGVADLQVPGRYEFLGIVGAVIAGFVVVSIRKLHERESSSTIFGAQCLYGLTISAIPTVDQITEYTTLILAVLIASGLTAAFGQLAMTRAYKDLSVAQGSILQLLVPPAVALGGVIFFNETYRGFELIGAGLILAGCLVTARTRPRLASGLPAKEIKSKCQPPPDRPLG
jgi:drug/metabolite transporter (DMT)-like permease